MKKNCLLIIFVFISSLTFAENSNTVVENLKFSGDFRLRYEYFDNEDSMTRGKTRIQLRLNAFTKISDCWDLGFSLATGSEEDPTSTNQSMDNNFTQKNVWLDKAYVTYRKGQFLFTGGKMKNPFVNTDIIWDSDINLEGASEKWEFNGNSYITLGQFSLKESKDHADAYLLSVQGGMKLGKLGINAAYYAFQNYVDYAPKASGNIFENETEFKVFDMLLQFEINKSLSVFGDYVVNSGANLTTSTGEKEDTAFGFGLQYKFDLWSFQIMYKNIEPNATVGAFADATFGGTDKKGFQATLKKSISKKMNASVSVYNSSSTLFDNNETTVVDFDLNFKF